ncbi:Polysaccharide biosynthesis protein [Pelotomaculum sp. FP]|uniref:lipopolysaccharide biosynthesis protein n=1 Tax=Pelotomaculum sp. FP TaxID=261474 RepID=UPI001064FEE2|nr:hypothetical protein [Pelotomaculum sp. FP]TEB14252.1 Polysaccharide biosynthesis protein [Pelotomaculum sp. FP]
MEESVLRKFANNLMFAFGAQGISLFLSILMSLVVPKILGVEEFGYWQLFLFYSNYIGFFHFGLNDGLYLRHGGKEYKELNHSLIGSQFWAAVATQTIIAIGIVLYACNYTDDSQRKFVLITTGIHLILFNASNYLGYLFQAINDTRRYSISIMVDKIVFIISVLGLLIAGINRFELFVALYLVSRLLSLIYCVYYGKEIVFAHLSKITTTVREAKINIYVGIFLMLSNISSQLIIGSGRWTIDTVWGIEAFGKFSFSLSLTAFVLLFINQISMVMFPALRKTNGENQKKVYRSVRDVLSIMLPAVLIFYLPLKLVIGIWLPQYKESLEILVVLLPVCTYSAKMQLLSNTYLKVLRKEKVLFFINLSAVFISMSLSLIGAYIIGNIYVIGIFMLVATACRSIMADLFLSRMMRFNIIQDLIAECMLVFIFVLAFSCLQNFMAFTAYLFAYMLFFAAFRKKFKGIAALTNKVMKNRGNQI